MERLGSKTAARQIAQDVGAPMVPGTLDPIKTLDEAAEIARQIGFSVILKAVAGGGGKGMRSIATESELASAWRDATSEAQNAFGDARLYLEKYLERPRISRSRYSRIITEILSFSANANVPCNDGTRR